MDEKRTSLFDDHEMNKRQGENSLMNKLIE